MIQDAMFSLREICSHQDTCHSKRSCLTGTPKFGGPPPKLLRPDGPSDSAGGSAGTPSQTADSHEQEQTAGSFDPPQASPDKTKQIKRSKEEVQKRNKEVSVTSIFQVLLFNFWTSYF